MHRYVLPLALVCLVGCGGSGSEPDKGPTTTTSIAVNVQTPLFVIDVAFELSSTAVGHLAGTVTEVWRMPNVPGELRLVEDIVGSPQAEGFGPSLSKLMIMRKLRR